MAQQPNECLEKSEIVELSTSSRNTSKTLHLLDSYEPEHSLFQGESGFRYASSGSIVIYTDGSCLSNGRSNPLAAIGVYFGPESPVNVSSRLASKYIPSNNTAEIVAVTTAFRLCKQYKIRDVEIRTDSRFLITCITELADTWRLNGWRKTNGKPVVNAAELKELLDESCDLNVTWVHVQGHAHDEGNRCVDFLARMATINEFLQRQDYELIDYKKLYYKNLFSKKNRK